jgi:NH3-dependent NAD+ synthetase
VPPLRSTSETLENSSEQARSVQMRRKHKNIKPIQDSMKMNKAMMNTFWKKKDITE